MNDKRISICIIAHNAYGVLAGIDTGHAGGIEVQTPLMARWLARHGYDVSMITWDEGLNDNVNEIIDGVRSIKLCRRDAGIRIVRFFHPRWTSFVKALREADADVYYYNCGDLGLGQLAAWARLNNKKVIYSIANERDVYQDLTHWDSLRDRYMYKYGLKRVDKIIAQTDTQKNILEREYGLKSDMVPMPCEGFSEYLNTSENRLSADPKRILWVGRFTDVKRVDWLLDIAEECTDLQFDIVGAENQPTKYATEVISRAKKIKNVTLHGRIKHKDMGNFYKQAALFCATAVYEGFPNVYLEAWSTALPIVSTFDPDGIIAGNGIGEVASDKKSLIASIRSLLELPNHTSSSRAAREFFLNNHSVDSSLKIFDQKIKAVALGTTTA